MQADLVLEGGGVKGVGLVGAVSVLADEGYRFQRIAGTSAGAIVGALLAANVPLARLEELLRTVDFTRFRDRGLLSRVPLVGPALKFLVDKGVFGGDELRRWLGEVLAEHGVRTFGDLRLDDPGGDLPPERSYRLVVVAADISLGRLALLPWDYPRYGLDPDDVPVADAVRALMSIPFFYEPVTLEDRANGTTSYLVDGGLLSNFPVWLFDRTDGQPPRWPTFGVKLSGHPGADLRPNRIRGPVSFAQALVTTMLNAHDQRHVDDPCVQRRTVFVDAGAVRATDFDLPAETRERLLRAGHDAAQRFLARWDLDSYLMDCRSQAAPVGSEPSARGRF